MQKKWPVTGVLLGLLLFGLPATGGAQGSALSGYMDFHYNKRRARRRPSRLPPLRPVHHPRLHAAIRFVGELEVEHALVEGLEEAGELELEQAYLDFLLSPAFNIRAGMMLVPVGIINERHEPPVFYGVERPFVDTVIIPTTWFEAGVGVHGELGSGWRYRVLVMAPLDAAEFSAAKGIREGARRVPRRTSAISPRPAALEYLGIRGPHAGRELLDRQESSFTPARSIRAVDVGRGRRPLPSRGSLELRGEFAQVASPTPIA